MRLELQAVSLMSMRIGRTRNPLHTNVYPVEVKRARLHFTTKDVSLQTGMQARVG